MAKRTHYEILGVEKNASYEEIKEVRNFLVSGMHPDRFEEGSKNWLRANERLKEINAAYEILADPEKRWTYDEELGNGAVTTDENPVVESEHATESRVSSHRRGWLLLLVLAAILGGGAWFLFSTRSAKSEGNQTEVSQVAKVKSASGELDETFNPGSGANSFVVRTRALKDGKILIAGWFTKYNEVKISYLARLNADGTLDPTFPKGDGPDGPIYEMVVQPDGKILLGGNFNHINGEWSPKLARLNPDGFRDKTFVVKDGLDRPARAFGFSKDGKILVAGEFNTFDGLPQPKLMRFNADGTRDITFLNNGNVSGDILSMTVQPDGKIWIGGNGLTQYNQVPCLNLIRLNKDGTVDKSVTAPLVDNAITVVTLQPDGKVVLGGHFKTVGNTSSVGIARLNKDGTVDGTFRPGSVESASVVDAMLIDAEGRIVIGGAFNLIQGEPSHFIARLNKDGSLDKTFLSEPGFDVGILGMDFQADGKIVMGGGFRRFKGVSRNLVARLK